MNGARRFLDSMRGGPNGGSYGYTDFASPVTFRELVAMQLLQPLALPDSMLYVPEDKRQTLEQWAQSACSHWSQNSQVC